MKKPKNNLGALCYIHSGDARVKRRLAFGFPTGVKPKPLDRRPLEVRVFEEYEPDSLEGFCITVPEVEDVGPLELIEIDGTHTSNLHQGIGVIGAWTITVDRFTKATSGGLWFQFPYVFPRD
jgi:hypothetical protein